MKLIDVLKKMKVSDLKKEIDKQNIKGYSKLKKAEIIKIMTDRADKFKYLLLDNMKQKKELLQDKIKLKEAKDKLKKLTAKKTEPKKAEPKKQIIKTKTGVVTVKPKKEERKLTEIEKIRIRLEKISNIKGSLMNPNQKKELKKLLDERERLREKMNNLLKKKLEEPKKAEPKKAEPKKAEPKKITYEYLENNKKRQTDYVLKVGRMMRKYNFLPVEEKRTLLNKKLKKEIEEHMKFIFNAPKSMREYLSEQFEDKQEFEGQFEKDYDDFINPHWTQDPDGTRPKKKEPKKEPKSKKAEPKKEPKSKKAEPKKEPEPKKETTNKLKAIVRKVKPGDPGFVANFQKLSRQGQLKAMLKQIEITGQPLKKNEYQEMADKFYNGIFSTLNKSASRAIPEIINNYHLPLSALEILYQGQNKGSQIDFYPTPKKCVDELIDALPSGFKPNNKGNNRQQQTKILEGTAGIGNVAYFINQINPNYTIQANELNKGLYTLMKNFLPSNIETTNKDFFNINEDYDIIFLNPPFGSVSQGTANFYFKFLLHALKILNDNKGGYIMFISPPLIKFKENSKGQVVHGEDQYSQISNFFKSQDKENGIFPDTMIKYINELNNKNFSKKDFSKVLTLLNNYESLPEDPDFDLEELYNLIEDDYSFTYGEVVGMCEGFGGTGIRAQMNLIQVMK
jgi:predicted RNA methylase